MDANFTEEMVVFNVPRRREGACQKNLTKKSLSLDFTFNTGAGLMPDA